MNQVKIGKFIATRRKEKGFTQVQLSEKLGITDRAVSKWENGKSMPDFSIMLDLCKELDVTVNDLLSGEIVKEDEYKKKLEDNLLVAVKEKEQADKRLLKLEWVITIFMMIVAFPLLGVAAYVEMETHFRIILIVLAFVIVIVAACIAIRIEQTAGYYHCQKCGHKYVPKYASVLFALHSGRTRYLKCPHCGQRSWQKKVISKDD